MSRDTPGPVARQLRQEGGFGCCACGHPFFEYHHIVPFAERQDFVPADMMILCPNHHHQANIGAVDQQQQREWKRSAFNVARGYADGQLFVASKSLAVELGSIQFFGAGVKLVVDGQPLLKLKLDEGGRLALSLDVYAEDDTLLISIVDNEWISGDPLPWDLQFGYRWLTLRQRERHIALSLDARQQPVRVLGELWRKGQQFVIRQEALLFNGVAHNVGFANLGFAGMMLTADTAAKQFAMAPDPAIGRGIMVSRADTTERFEEGLKAYQGLLARMNPGRNDPCPCESGKKWEHCHGAD
jgi:hypothetical protein